MRTSEPGTPGEWFQFAVELKETGRLIGDCGLKTAEDGRQGEVGFTLSREHQGKGFAFEAVSRLLDYAFGDLGLHRIVAVADQENASSVALLERLGMRREVSLVQNAWFKGRWASEYLYAILRDKWPPKREQCESGMQKLRITSEPQASPEDTAVIRDGLARFNVAQTQHTYYSPLANFLRDERGAVLGGALGDVWGGWLELTFLWVAEPVRGQGYGKRLLRAAEEEARTQGCQGVFLSTFSFQARPFYERLGYEVFGELPDNPAGHGLYFMKKMLEVRQTNSEPG
jgi:RimJ/RimL family protein N-acetyltransferase